MALRASECNGWPRRWASGRRRDWDPRRSRMTGLRDYRLRTERPGSQRSEIRGRRTEVAGQKTVAGVIQPLSIGLWPFSHEYPGYARRPFAPRRANPGWITQSLQGWVWWRLVGARLRVASARQGRENGGRGAEAQSTLLAGKVDVGWLLPGAAPGLFAARGLLRETR